jgi:hypothetical protein
VGRFFSVLVVCGLLASCQNQTHAVFSPAPSPTPHTQPTAAILQSADVPAGLTVCLGSGPIDVYLSVLQNSDPELASLLSQEWLVMVQRGATRGAISVFTADGSACKVELGAATGVKAMTSFVAEFADAGEADRAWQAGVFGFAPPPPGVLSPGVIVGTATGLGPSSFTYDRPSVRLACWRHGLYVALVAVSNLDANAFRAATAAIDPRLN